MFDAFVATAVAASVTSATTCKRGCDGVCGSENVFGCDGVCQSGKSFGCDGICDSGLVFGCDGACGNGEFIPGCDDRCTIGCDGVCGSGNVTGCDGVCDSGKVISGCDNQCGSAKVLGCDSVCGSGAVAGCDGVCQSGTAVSGCDERCGSTKAIGCDGVCGSNATRGCDGVCGGPTERGCDGVCGSGKAFGCDGVCGSGKVPSGCDATCGSTKAVSGCDSRCGSRACVGCDGVCGSGRRQAVAHGDPHYMLLNGSGPVDCFELGWRTFASGCVARAGRQPTCWSVGVRHVPWSRNPLAAVIDAVNVSVYAPSRTTTLALGPGPWGNATYNAGRMDEIIVGFRDGVAVTRTTVVAAGLDLNLTIEAWSSRGQVRPHWLPDHWKRLLLTDLLFDRSIQFDHWLQLPDRALH